jgi:hypothetical protein
VLLIWKNIAVFLLKSLTTFKNYDKIFKALTAINRGKILILILIIIIIIIIIILIIKEKLKIKN